MSPRRVLHRLSTTDRRRLQILAVAGAGVATALMWIADGFLAALGVGLVASLALVAIKLSLVSLVAVQRLEGATGRNPAPAPAPAPPPPPAVQCNICGGAAFTAYNGRSMARCRGCRSLERHRVCYEVYRREGVLTPSDQTRTLIQFAPEKVVHDLLANVPGLHYTSADMSPERYPHAQPLQLRLPDDLSMFPDANFDFVIHNHVWEHIPGSWKDHVEPFRRILKVGGKMIFTFPYSPVSAPAETIEGGELLESDADRVSVFGQRDHVRRFGRDFIDHMQRVPGATFRLDDISEEDKRSIAGCPNGVGVVVFTFERTA